MGKVSFRLIRYLKALAALPFHQRRSLEVERRWQEYRPRKIKDWGQAQSLSILPLVDWHTSREDLLGEMGVSYLLRTDQTSVLFDVGFNEKETSPSPLEHNMQKLGVSVDDVDAIVISHNHFDHVGGHRWSVQKTFSLGNKQIDLTGKRVFTPVPMTYPGLYPKTAADPVVIAPGVATSGAISRQLFTGRVEEQSLAVNVKDKGIVLIVGCGHQTLPKILMRAAQIFSEPIYGIVGGLHYPVPTGRVKWMGCNAQRLFSSGEGLLNPLLESEVKENMAFLKKFNPHIVGLSGHDSSDEAIAWFRQAFGPAYRDVRVGEEIEI